MTVTYRDDMIGRNFATAWVLVDTATQILKIENFENHVFVDMVVNDLYERTTKDGRTWYEQTVAKITVNTPEAEYNENPNFYENTEVNKNQAHLVKRSTDVSLWDKFIETFH